MALIGNLWRRWCCPVLLLAGLLLAQGCATSRYDSTSGVPDRQKLAASNAAFRVGSVQYESVTKPADTTEDLSTRLLALSVPEMQQAGRQRFPGFISDDASAIPLHLVVKCKAYHDKGALNLLANLPAVLSCQLVFPFIDCFYGEYSVDVAARDEVEDLPCLSPRKFVRKDTMCMSLLTPTALLNLAGPSRFSTCGTMEGLVNTNIGRRVSLECLLDEVVCAVQQRDPAEWQKLYAARRARVVRTTWDGHPAWLRLDGSDSRSRQVAVYAADPASGEPPLERVTVARSSGAGGWEVQPGYATTANTPTLLTVQMEGGRLGLPSAQAVEAPDPRDFLDGTDTDPAVAQWRTRMLVYAKNCTLPDWLRTKTRPELQDLLAVLEASLVELAHASQMARSRGQHMIETNQGDPMKEREWSAIYSQRMAVLQAFTEPIKARLSEL